MTTATEKIRTIPQAIAAMKKIESKKIVSHHDRVKSLRIGQAIDAAEKIIRWEELEKSYDDRGDCVMHEQTHRQRVEAEECLSPLATQLLADMRASGKH